MFSFRPQEIHVRRAIIGGGKVSRRDYNGMREKSSSGLESDRGATRRVKRREKDRIKKITSSLLPSLRDSQKISGEERKKITRLSFSVQLHAFFRKRSFFFNSHSFSFADKVPSLSFSPPPLRVPLPPPFILPCFTSSSSSSKFTFLLSHPPHRLPRPLPLFFSRRRP